MKRKSPGSRRSENEKKRKIPITDRISKRERERSDDRSRRVSRGLQEKSHHENDKSRINHGEKRKSNDSRKTVKSKIQRISKDSRGSDRTHRTSPTGRRIPNENEKSDDRMRDDRHKSPRIQDNGNVEAASLRIFVARSHEEEDTSNKKGDGQRSEQNLSNKRKVEFVKSKSLNRH